MTGAEVTTLWIHDKIDDKHWNLLTVIELVPKGQSWSPDLEVIDKYDCYHPLRQYALPSGRWLLNATRQRLKDVALAWSCFKKGRAHVGFRVGGQRIAIRAVDSECLYPVNGMITVPPRHEVSSDESADPLQRVLPNRLVTVRACAQLLPDANFYDILDSTDLSAATVQAKKWLGICLEGAHELLGATIWSEPDPVFRAVRWGLGSKSDSLWIDGYQRDKSVLDPMMVTAWEDAPLGCRPLFQSVWHGGSVNFPIQVGGGAVGLQIHDGNGQILEDRRARFINSIKINTRLGAGSRSVQFSTTSRGRQYQEIPRWTDLGSTEIGGSDSLESALRLHAQERHQRLLQRRGDFVYLSPFEEGSPERGTQFVRAILHEVRNRCILADPYLGAGEVRAFAVFVSNLDASVELITSHAFLRVKSNELDVSNGRLLAEEIYRQGKQDPFFSPNVTVLQGADTSPLHDRFIIADESVYHLGGSLNHIGCSGMVISRVPAPEAVLKDINRWMDGEESETLNEWLERRGEYEL